MAIVLTKDEKRTFYSFLGLYLSSSLFLIGIISWLTFITQSKQLEELTLSKMEVTASELSLQIIQAHMNGLNLDLQNLQISNDFKYALFDAKQRPIHTQFKQKIDFSEKIFKTENKFFYINKGTAGHLAVTYVVIKEHSLQKTLKELKQNIIYITIFIYLVIALVGFFLSKLFIYPIQSQREKLNTFIKDTTHELNTPLSAILLCVSSENFYSEENREHIKSSAKKISNLYKDLTYLTLKNVKKEDTSLIDISKILKDELTYHGKLAKKKKITLTQSIQKTSFKIGKDNFERLINNLISNAIKYTKRNGQVNIKLKDNILSIEDNGVGIEKEKLDKIFERYYRATSSVGGFGIGLNIVYSICKNYGIKIDVKSKINEGTTFTLDFN